MSSPFMTVEECAEYTRISPEALYQKVHRRQIPCRKHGRQLLFHKDEIDAWSIAQSKPVRVTPLSKFQEARLRLKTGGR